MRLGCFLVTFSVLASLVLEPPKAKAFVMTSSAVTSLASGFLSACGLTPVVSGMGSSSEVNGSVARLIQDFLNEEVGGISVADWALSFGEIGLAVKDKKIVIPKPFAEKLGEFARWVAGKYGTQAGVNVVYSDRSITANDGTVYNLSVPLGSIVSEYYGSSCSQYSLGTNIFSLAAGYTAENPNEVSFGEGSICLYTPSESNLNFAWKRPGQTLGHGGMCSVVTFYLLSDNRLGIAYILSSKPGRLHCTNYAYISISETSVSDNSLSVDVAETMQEVLDRLTALEEGQSIALDVGATQSMEIQDILQSILDAILAGDLAASAEIVDTAEVPVEPEEPDPPVVPVVPSGLDKLGAALTSRFPFSIPWDVYKGVKLLAAPPKAPYFEVDFLAPIAYRVGGWKGSTKIVLDFSEYEIIGQVCRWTSTVGFCLMLASGTKRLIWTA